MLYVAFIVGSISFFPCGTFYYRVVDRIQSHLLALANGLFNWFGSCFVWVNELDVGSERSGSPDIF